MNHSLSLRCSTRPGFTLVEIMIVVAILAMVAMIAIPSSLRAHRRSQATRVLNDLRLIDNALDHWAAEGNRSPGTVANFPDLRPYIKPDTQLANTGADVFGNAFGPDFTVDTFPAVPRKTRDSLGDVVPVSFWNPYQL